MTATPEQFAHAARHHATLARYARLAWGPRNTRALFHSAYAVRYARAARIGLIARAKAERAAAPKW